MFGCIDIAEQVYKWVTLYKTTGGTEYDQASHVKKIKGEWSASTTNTNNDRAGKRNNNHADH